ncbi:MAG TPA: hypothetical protein VF793_15540, partial [Telluria sp.]
GLVGGLREAGQAARQQGGGQDESFHCVVSRIDGSGAMPCRPAIIDHALLVVKLIFVCIKCVRERTPDNRRAQPGSFCLLLAGLCLSRPAGTEPEHSFHSSTHRNVGEVRSGEHMI